MITFFTSPKPFNDLHSQSQVNAISSWLRIPDSEVVITGKEDGVENTVNFMNLGWLPNLIVSESGQPYFNDAINQVREYSEKDYLCWVSCDVMLFGFFKDIINQARERCGENFVLSGRRFDIDSKVDFLKVDGDMIRAFRQVGNLRAPYTLDYFLFPKELYKDVPDFLIARAHYDNWMIWSALDKGIPVVDCTEVVTAVHQNHPRYIHEIPIPKEELDNNRKLSKDLGHVADLRQATHKFIDSEVEEL